MEQINAKEWLGMTLRNLARRVKYNAFDLVRRYHKALPQFIELYSGSLDRPGPIFPKDGQLCFTLTRMLLPDVILEIGVGAAASTVAFAEALKANNNGRLISIDMDEYFINRAEMILRAHNLAGLCTFVLGSSDDEKVKRRVTDLIESADIIFIDGDHSFKGCLSDFETYHDLLSDNGIILFHDTGPFPIKELSKVRQLPYPPHEEEPVRTHNGKGIYHRPGVAKAVDWIMDHYAAYSLVNLHTLHETTCGMAILQRKNKLYVPEET